MTTSLMDLLEVEEFTELNRRASSWKTCAVGELLDLQDIPCSSNVLEELIQEHDPDLFEAGMNVANLAMDVLNDQREEDINSLSDYLSLIEDHYPNPELIKALEEYR